MRSEQEMLKLILSTAEQDQRIRAVIMNGSRVNPNMPADIFQDYDIVYIVSDVAPFVNNPDWIQRFGELVIYQMPEAMGNPPPMVDGHFAYLMQFVDGNRIDLTLFPLSKLNELGRDSLSRLLLDKDGIIAPFPAPNDSDYLPKPPTAQAFADCCNEFWWVTTYVAKGLWRQQLSYAKCMQEQPVRDQLLLMLTWHVATKTDFGVNLGYCGKKLKHYLEPGLWTLFEQTYADADQEHSWAALLHMSELFRIAATHVAQHFDFDYPYGDDERVSAYIRRVRALPRDATTFNVPGSTPA